MQAPPSPPHIEELSDAEEVVDLERSRRDPTDTARGHTSDADTSAPASVESSLCSSSSEDSASDSLTAYEVLGVETNATRHVIKKAFKRKVSMCCLI